MELDIEHLWLPTQKKYHVFVFSQWIIQIFMQCTVCQSIYRPHFTDVYNR